MAKAARPPAKSKPKPAPTARSPKKPAAPFATDDGNEALAHFLALAVARYEAGDVPHYNADLDVVPGNVSRALDAVTPHLDSAAPGVRARVLELQPLVLALIVADARVVEALSDRAIAKLQAEQRPMRLSTLSFLEAVSTQGACEIVPPERVAAVRAGKGQIDEARDGVNIVAIFREFEEALRGKHPYSAAQLASFGAKSASLLRLLSPTEAAKIVGETSVSEETKVRDGLWALLNDRYDELLVVAAGKWGVRKLYDFVPALSGRTRTGAKEKSAEPSGEGSGGEKPAKDPPADEAKKPAK